MRAHTLLQSFRHAFAGLAYVLRTQRNARIHLAAAIAIALLGGWVKLSADKWAILALTIGVVFSFELLNTMVETLVDLVSPDHHPLARIAKDVAAAAVLVSALLAVAVGLLVLGPPLWSNVFSNSAFDREPMASAESSRRWCPSDGWRWTSPECEAGDPRHNGVPAGSGANRETPRSPLARG